MFLEHSATLPWLGRNLLGQWWGDVFESIGRQRSFRADVLGPPHIHSVSQKTLLQHPVDSGTAVYNTRRSFFRLKKSRSLAWPGSPASCLTPVLATFIIVWPVQALRRVEWTNVEMTKKTSILYISTCFRIIFNQRHDSVVVLSQPWSNTSVKISWQGILIGIFPRL